MVGQYKMNRFALIIGLEKYAERITAVRFAENDATKLHECLIELGIDPRDITCLQSSQATKTKVESELRRIVALANKGDEILLFFAGHGVSISGSNYITCYDTVPTDLVNSCISLQWIMNLFKTSASERKIIFLDSCHSGLEIDESMRGIIDSMNEFEIDAFFADSEYEVGFASCRADQSSYSSPNLRHGIWTYHLLEALRGDASSAVEKDKYITSSSLQNFLATQVPKTLRMEHPNPVPQTPKCFGSFSKEFQLFNLDPILAKREAERKARVTGLKSVDLIGRKGGAIRELRGFKKGFHRVPDSVDSYTQSFVEGIASDDLEQEATEIHDKLKANFKYKRKEIKFDIDGASAIIATKDFDLSIHYTQDSDDAAAYTIEYQINNIKDPDVLLNDGLQKILNRHFDQVRFLIDGSINLEDMIDAIEAEEPEGVDLEYPADCSSLTISLLGCDWEILVTSHGVSIVNSYLESPTKMLSYLKDGRNLIYSQSLLRPLL